MEAWLSWSSPLGSKQADLREGRGRGGEPREWRGGSRGWCPMRRGPLDVEDPDSTAGPRKVSPHVEVVSDVSHTHTSPHSLSRPKRWEIGIILPLPRRAHGPGEVKSLVQGPTVSVRAGIPAQPSPAHSRDRTLSHAHLLPGRVSRTCEGTAHGPGAARHPGLPAPGTPSWRKTEDTGHPVTQ